MSRTLVRFLASIALVAAGSYSSTAAFATTTHTRAVALVSFVGKYNFHLSVSGMATSCVVDINANGTAVAECSGNSAHWTASGKKITIVYKASGTETFKGKKTARGISSKAHPGSYSNSKGMHGTWYAVKVKA